MVVISSFLICCDSITSELRYRYQVPGYQIPDTSPRLYRYQVPYYGFGEKAVQMCVEGRMMPGHDVANITAKSNTVYDVIFFHSYTHCHELF